MVTSKIDRLMSVIGISKQVKTTLLITTKSRFNASLKAALSTHLHGVLVW